MDEAHGVLSGPATQKILQRELHDFGDTRYRRLAGISAAHIYNLRRGRIYRQRRITYQPTRPTPVSIGERRAPRPEGRPGYLRVDTVHQGDQDGSKGAYHIDAVDEVTQWQVVGATAQISEALADPCAGGHVGAVSVPDSQASTPTTARSLLTTGWPNCSNKLLVEQTKSRPRHSNDNGLVESKNGAVVRKHMGYIDIAAEHAEAIERFYEEHLNPYSKLS